MGWKVRLSSQAELFVRYLFFFFTIFFFFQNNCAVHCSEKFLKVMQRVGIRIQEVQVMQNEGVLGASEPPK